MSSGGEKETLCAFYVTITDGHPNAVKNNRSCIEWNGYKDENVRCCPLLWKRCRDGMKECHELMMINNRNNNNNIQHDNHYHHHHHDNYHHDDQDAMKVLHHFDLLLVSDCLHFTNFHVDLAITIGRLLHVGGVCLLLQPCRGQSLQKFLQLIHFMNDNHNNDNNNDGNNHDNNNSHDNETDSLIKGPLFQVDLHEKHHSKLWNRHLSLMHEEKDESYNPDIHYPLLLVLQKLRDFSEEYDGGRAIHYDK